MSTLGLVEIRECLEPQEGHLSLLFYPQSGLIFKKTGNVRKNVEVPSSNFFCHGNQ
jgi:hypothetical protein